MTNGRLIIVVLSLMIGSLANGKELIQLNEKDSVTLRKDVISFDFTSSPLPNLDLTALCAGDLSQIGPLLVLIEPYVDDIGGYRFTTGVEGPLCTRLVQSDFSKHDYYRVLLTQTIGQHSLWDIEATVTVSEGENITTSFDGWLFRIDSEERRPENWLSIEESHSLALEGVLEIADKIDVDNLKNNFAADQYRHIGSRISETGDEFEFVPTYELMFNRYISWVNRINGEVSASKIPAAMH